jgi:hypothetical protein
LLGALLHDFYFLLCQLVQLINQPVNLLVGGGDLVLQQGEGFAGLGGSSAAAMFEPVR